MGAIFGRSLVCVERLGKVIETTAKVTGKITLRMFQFDLLAMGAGLFDPDNGFTQFNQYLHSNPFYNGFQAVMTVMSIFTGAAYSTMKCFVAGTMILTARGLMSIEDIQAGDKVISTSEEDFKVKEKRVVETYIRETRELIHLTITGEKVSTTYTHPFYVKERGFVEAGELEVGEELYDAKGNVLYVEETKRELLNEPVKVYNFQVEDYHTYHVGNNGILVHNADYPKTGGGKSGDPDKYKTKKKVNGKQKDDIPDRFKGEKPKMGESGKEAAKRVLKERGEYNPKKTGPGTEFNKLKKYFDTHFE